MYQNCGCKNSIFLIFLLLDHSSIGVAAEFSFVTSWRSKLGLSVHLHDWPHVGVIELMHPIVVVHWSLLCHAQLSFVDISVLVADRADDTIWGELDKTDHLGSQVDQSLLVRGVEKVTGSRTKEARFVEADIVSQELFQSKVGKDCHKDLRDVCILDPSGLQLRFGSLVHDVDYVQLGHPVDLHCKQFVLLRLARSLAFGQHGMSFIDDEGSTSGKRSLDVLGLQKLLYSRGTARCA